MLVIIIMIHVIVLKTFFSYISLFTRAFVCLS